jgi:hypothetical protein
MRTPSLHAAQGLDVAFAKGHSGKQWRSRKAVTPGRRRSRPPSGQTLVLPTPAVYSP